MHCFRAAGLRAPVKSIQRLVSSSRVRRRSLGPCQALTFLVGFIGLQLHAPLTAEEALGDLIPPPLLQSLLHQTPNSWALLALAGQLQDFSHLLI